MSNQLITWRQEMEDSMVSTMKIMSTLSVGFETLTREVQDIKQDLKKRIYLSNTHMVSLKRIVKERAARICKDNDYDYKKAYRYIIQAIWRTVNDQYNVPCYRELPDAYYNEIAESVNSWILSETIAERIIAA